ncbi:MAG: ParB/RepB/Spo0J family partition protein [Thermoflexales bacterium]|nr:ParB/RepB/Spo0J family partition protein [Thermoflexales bacterium]MCX7937848.1 ParB/RepB/Spo0J family partition protein [Thermoflexales bacterium]MDW8292912.1 ParB/RepB/Spo0J family partition protein [Anaerolineae bacterium]
MAPKIGLGRGLDALLPANPAGEAQASTQGSIVELPVHEIRANPRQPRMARGQEALNLEELAASIREHGVLQPIIVTRTQGEGAPYTLIAGERRWRAAQLAGLTHIPAIIKEVSSREQLELALIENIQRSDLSPLEEANAYQQLINEFGMTQELVADRVGKSRAAVANAIRLLKLPGQIQAALMQGEITEGHARALLGLSSAADQLAVLQEIRSRGLNVRQTEELVRRMTSGTPRSKKIERHEHWREAREYEARLREALQTKVSLQRSRKGGRIVIEFYSDEEFQVLFERLVGESA